MITQAQNTQNERHPAAPVGFIREFPFTKDAEDYETLMNLHKDDHLYKGRVCHDHGVGIEQVWEPETGIYYQITSDGDRNLTRADLSKVRGLLARAIQWEAEYPKGNAETVYLLNGVHVQTFTDEDGTQRTSIGVDADLSASMAPGAVKHLAEFLFRHAVITEALHNAGMEF